MTKRPTTRIGSVRNYRRRMDQLLIRADRGEISWKDAQSGISALKSVAEVMLGERLMAAQGIEDMEPEHPLGLDGGFDDYAPHKKDPRARKEYTYKDGEKQGKLQDRRDEEARRRVRKEVESRMAFAPLPEEQNVPTTSGEMKNRVAYLKRETSKGRRLQ